VHAAELGFNILVSSWVAGLEKERDESALDCLLKSRTAWTTN
jgi:hypothetical protein